MPPRSRLNDLRGMPWWRRAEPGRAGRRL